MARDPHEETRRVGESFRGQLDDALLDDALEYVDHGECRLAIEILATQLHEHDVPIKRSQYVAVMETWTYLSPLEVPNSALLEDLIID